MGAARRSASDSPIMAIFSTRVAMKFETGLSRYATTIGRSARAASSVVVPDLHSPASAAANTGSVSPVWITMSPGAG